MSRPARATAGSRRGKLRAEIAALGATAASTACATGERRNESSLVEALKRVVGSRTMTVDEAMQGVLEAGYRSTSAAFRRIVNVTLSRGSEFERVARGRYRLK